VADHYGDSLTIWDWEKKVPVQTIKLGAEGLLPLELRFLHDPSKAHAYVGAALSSNVLHITKVHLADLHEI
jgi:selenium-binding protein 1